MDAGNISASVPANTKTVGIIYNFAVRGSVGCAKPLISCTRESWHKSCRLKTKQIPEGALLFFGGQAHDWA